jgi:hypothetical protein
MEAHLPECLTRQLGAAELVPPNIWEIIEEVVRQDSAMLSEAKTAGLDDCEWWRP